MKLKSVDISEFMKTIQTCSGQVCLNTSEGDRLIVNSSLFGRIGLDLFFAVAQKLDVSIDCEDQQDQSKIEQFLTRHAR